MSPGEGVTTTIGLSEGNTSSKRYGCVLRNMQVVSNSPTRKVSGPGLHEVKNKKKKRKKRRKIARLEFEVTLQKKEESPSTQQKQDLLESKPQMCQQAAHVDAKEGPKLSAKKMSGEERSNSSNCGRKKHVRSCSRDKNKYIQKSLSPFIVKQKK